MSQISVGIAPVVSVEHVEMAQQSTIFRRWLQSLDPRFAPSAINLQAVDFRGKPSAGSVLFVRMLVKAANAPFNQIVELRGGTSVMLPILECEGQLYTVLVKQPRLAIGEYEAVELPAGMIDGGTFAGAAAKELEQELDLTFTEKELVDLTPVLGTIHFSCGLLDEDARFFLGHKNVSPKELRAMQGKATGVAEEGESITLWVVPLDQMIDRTRDGKAFIAWTLYQRWLKT